MPRTQIQITTKIHNPNRIIKTLVNRIDRHKKLLSTPNQSKNNRNQPLHKLLNLILITTRTNPQKLLIQISKLRIPKLLKLLKSKENPGHNSSTLSEPKLFNPCKNPISKPCFPSNKPPFLYSSKTTTWLSKLKPAVVKPSHSSFPYSKNTLP